ncbi:MAG: helix-turn-helix domain-containing protein [Patescibacteria group bacterium]
MEILEQLNQLGLKGNEASAYLALLRLQKANPHQIAKEANIERTTVYKILEELAEKGLIAKSAEGKRLNYVAESPISIKHFIHKQESLIDCILPTLFAFSGSKKIRPVIKFYENIEGIKKALMDSLNCQEKLRRDFASVQDLVNFLGLRVITNQINERVKRGIYVRSLRCVSKNKNLSEKDWFLKKENQDILREVRYLDKLIQIKPTVMIYDHIVTMISTEKESFALVIESPELSGALKVLFDIAWENSKK